MKSSVICDCLYTCNKVTTDPQTWQPADWMAIPETEPFFRPNGEEQAKLQTKVRAVWTETALHVSFWSDDPEPWATKTEHDSNLYEEEVVEIFLAPGKDITRYFEFEINPLGTLFDAAIQWFDVGVIEVGREWDCNGLIGRVIIEPQKGWWAFLKIPFDGIKEKPKPIDTWRVNFYRIKRRPFKEFSSWSPLYTDPMQFHTPERFGVIRFMERG